MRTRPQRRDMMRAAVTPPPGVRYRQAEFLGGRIINGYCIVKAKARVEAVTKRKKKWLVAHLGATYARMVEDVASAVAKVGETLGKVLGPALDDVADIMTRIAADNPRPCPGCGSDRDVRLYKDIGRDRWFMACARHTEFHGPCSGDPRWARTYGSLLWDEGIAGAEEAEPDVDQRASTVYAEPYWDEYTSERELACDRRTYITLMRHRLGLTQTRLAELAGCSPSTVSAIERGRLSALPSELGLMRTLATYDGSR